MAADGRMTVMLVLEISPAQTPTDPVEWTLRHRAEPYVLAADVREAEPGVAQAGWTWHTGAAGWTWQLAVEAILGLTLRRGVEVMALGLWCWGTGKGRTVKMRFSTCLVFVKNGIV